MTFRQYCNLPGNTSGAFLPSGTASMNNYYYNGSPFPGPYISIIYRSTHTHPSTASSTRTLFVHSTFKLQLEQHHRTILWIFAAIRVKNRWQIHLNNGWALRLPRPPPPTTGGRSDTQWPIKQLLIGPMVVVLVLQLLPLLFPFTQFNCLLSTKLAKTFPSLLPPRPHLSIPSHPLSISSDSTTSFVVPCVCRKTPNIVSPDD